MKWVCDKGNNACNLDSVHMIMMNHIQTHHTSYSYTHTHTYSTTAGLVSPINNNKNSVWLSDTRWFETKTFSFIDFKLGLFIYFFKTQHNCNINSEWSSSLHICPYEQIGPLCHKSLFKKLLLLCLVFGPFTICFYVPYFVKGFCLDEKQTGQYELKVKKRETWIT